MSRSELLAALIVSALLAVSPAIAQTDFDWIGATGDWSVGPNWDDGSGGAGPPAAGDNATIPQGSGGTPYTITMDAASAALNNLVLSGYWGTKNTSVITGAQTLNVAGTLDANCGGNPGQGFDIAAPLNVTG